MYNFESDKNQAVFQFLQYAECTATIIKNICNSKTSERWSLLAPFPGQDW